MGRPLKNEIDDLSQERFEHFGYNYEMARASRQLSRTSRDHMIKFELDPDYIVETMGTLEEEGHQLFAFLPDGVMRFRGEKYGEYDSLQSISNAQHAEDEFDKNGPWTWGYRDGKTLYDFCDFYWSEDQFPVDPETLMRDVADGNHQGFVLFEHGGFSEIAPIDKFFTHQWIIEKRFSGNNLAEAFKKSALPLKDLPGVLELRQACIDLDPGPWSEALIEFRDLIQDLEIVYDFEFDPVFRDGAPDPGHPNHIEWGFLRYTALRI